MSQLLVGSKNSEQFLDIGPMKDDEKNISLDQIDRCSLLLPKLQQNR